MTPYLRRLPRAAVDGLGPGVHGELFGADDNGGAVAGAVPHAGESALVACVLAAEVKAGEEKDGSGSRLDRPGRKGKAPLPAARAAPPTAARVWVRSFLCMRPLLLLDEPSVSLMLPRAVVAVKSPGGGPPPSETSTPWDSPYGYLLTVSERFWAWDSQRHSVGV